MLANRHEVGLKGILKALHGNFEVVLLPVFLLLLFFVFSVVSGAVKLWLGGK